MAVTNFGLLQSEQKLLWAKDTWRAARNYSFLTKFQGKDANSLVHRVTELKATEKGARAAITLVHDLEGDGVAGDRQLEGNEEAMKSSDIIIQIDQLRHANKHEGKMANQRSVVSFRENSKNNLAYWLGDRIDQMAFQTMAGISYTKHPTGFNRVGSDLPKLDFAADVSAPTASRRVRYDHVAKSIVVGAVTGDVVTGNTVTWEMLVQLKAYAKDSYIRGIREDGEETYHVFLSPQAMATLKLDPTYMLNLRHAQERSGSQPLFSGSSVKIDGLYIHEFRHVPHTLRAPSGSKFGGSGTIDGHYLLFCGAQALGMADIGAPDWVEKGFDYDNQQGISVGKIFGFRKPKFHSIYSGTTEDFGVIVGYCAFK
jgi:N4-gp56 family major capsid protein